MTAFIYRGTLYRDRGDTMEWLRKVRWGKWEWTKMKGFGARKVRRSVAHRVHGEQPPPEGK